MRLQLLLERQEIVYVLYAEHSPVGYLNTVFNKITLKLGLTLVSIIIFICIYFQG